MKACIRHLKSEHLSRENPHILPKRLALWSLCQGDGARTLQFPYAAPWNLLENYRRMGRNDCHSVAINQQV